MTRNRRFARETEDDDVAAKTDGVCPLCERPIPPDARQSDHHLIPKLKGGKGGPTVRLHHICHAAIHAHLTETELARAFSTIDALKGHPDIAHFVKWVAAKDPAFHAPTRGRARGRRRR
ncbi:MAG: HNH endonuclease [Alphaproteobacteria bacterium]|nr:HNH endonuclease [Alphaproteobacteria bacterium]